MPDKDVEMKDAAVAAAEPGKEEKDKDAAPAVDPAKEKAALILAGA